MCLLSEPYSQSILTITEETTRRDNFLMALKELLKNCRAIKEESF